VHSSLSLTQEKEALLTEINLHIKDISVIVALLRDNIEELTLPDIVFKHIELDKI
jgi:hypothetical protein